MGGLTKKVHAKMLYLECGVAYQPKALEAIARVMNGKGIAREIRTNAGKPAAVRLIKKDHAIAAEGKET